MVKLRNSYADYFKEFEPTKMTIKEKFKLFFKKKQYASDVVCKNDVIETSNTVIYKTLGDKKFILDSYGNTTIKFPDIQIILNDNKT